jgi:hypothetical protein
VPQRAVDDGRLYAKLLLAPLQPLELRLQELAELASDQLATRAKTALPSLASRASR